MVSGIFAGVFWAMGTVILGVALSMSPFVSGAEAAFLAPFVSTFLHDLCSALWTAGYNVSRREMRNVLSALCGNGGKLILVAALLGGPVGMTGYVLTIHYMGASVGAVASAAFPAVGAILACIFLREKMQWYRWIFLALTLGGVYALSYSPDLEIKNFWLGALGTLLCALGWGTEGVILAKVLRDPAVKNTHALQIRQIVSSLVYALVLLPLLHGWGFTARLFTGGTPMLFVCVALAALCSTASYLCYYKAISRIGASKAMALDVTYAAWAVVFSVALYRDTSILNPLTIICTLVVLVCGILAAADFRELTAKRQ